MAERDMERVAARRRSVGRIDELTLDHAWTFMAVALPVLLALSQPLVMNDLAYAVRVGNDILAGHGIPHLDSLTFTIAGHPWLDQEWGSQVVFAAVYRLGGWAGLFVFRAALIGLLFGGIDLLARRLGADARTAAMLTLGASMLVALGGPVTGMSLRAQLLGFALFVCGLGLSVCDDMRSRLIWLFPGLAAIWANVHGSFFLAALVVCLPPLPGGFRDARLLRRRLLVLAGTVAATLANPWGPRIWPYVVHVARNPLVQTTTGWNPPNPTTPWGLGFYLSAAIVLLVLWRSRRAASVAAAASWLAVFGVMAVVARRNIILWALVAAVTLGSVLRASGRTVLPSDERSRSPRGLAWFNATVMALVVLLGVLLIPPVRSATVGSDPLLENAPAWASAPIRNLPGSPHVLANINWASWVEFADPDARTFIDSRSVESPPSVIRAYFEFSEASPGWRRDLDRWQIDVVIAMRRTQMPLIRALARDPAWRIAARDDTGVMFVRAG